MALTQRNPRPGTRRVLRDVIAEDVHRAMREHAAEIRDERDVLRLGALRDVPGERIMFALADLVADGKVEGATGTGRMRAVEQHRGDAT